MTQRVKGVSRPRQSLLARERSPRLRLQVVNPIACAIALFLCSHSLGGVDTPKTKNPLIPLVVRLYEQVEYARALEVLQKALDRPENEPEELVWLQCMEGVLNAYLKNEAEAASALRRALALDANVKLPVKGSRKLRELFEQLRVEARTPPVKPVPSVVQAPAPIPVPALPLTVAPPPPKPVEARIEKAETRPAAPTVAVAPSPERVHVSHPATRVSLAREFTEQADARVEFDFVRLGLVPTFTGELSAGRWAGAVTLIVQRPPGLRVEGRFYPVELGPLRPYAALGSTAILKSALPPVCARAALGVDLKVGAIHLLGEVAGEHFFNAPSGYASNALLATLGAGWRY